MSQQLAPKRDQLIAGISALVAHIFLILLLLQNANSGLGNHRGNNTGHGDSLVAYPMLLPPSEIKTQRSSSTRNPMVTANTSHAASSIASPSQTVPAPSPNVAQPVSSIDLNAHANTPLINDLQRATHIFQAAANSTTAASSSGNSGNDLLANYQAAIRMAIFKKWQGLSRQPYPAECALHLSQSPGGIVTATSAAACNLSKEDRLQLEAAALMAQPMPYAGYESVFSSEMDLTL